MPEDGIIEKERSEVWEYADDRGRKILIRDGDKPQNCWTKKCTVDNDMTNYFILTANGDVIDKESISLSNPVMSFKRVSEKTYNAFMSYLALSTPHAFSNARKTFMLFG